MDKRRGSVLQRGVDSIGCALAGMQLKKDKFGNKKKLQLYNGQSTTLFFEKAQFWTHRVRNPYYRLLNGVNIAMAIFMGAASSHQLKDLSKTVAKLLKRREGHFPDNAQLFCILEKSSWRST